MTPPLAHAGHWVANALYALPVLVMVLALARQRIVDRRRGTGVTPVAEDPAAAEDRAPVPPA